MKVTQSIIYATACFVVLGVGLAPRPSGAAEPVIHAEDTVSLQVAGEPELSHTYVVDGAGYIVVGMAGKCRIGGLSPSAAEKSLTHSLARYLKICDVRLSVAAATVAPVTLLGEVAHPGTVKLRDGLTLLGAITEAGGGTARADLKKVRIFRASGQVLTADLNATLLDPVADLRLEAGDRIAIPRVDTAIWVEGQVKRPGELRLDEASTAYAAIRHGEPSEAADLSRVTIRRVGTPALLTVDLTPVEAGNPRADLPLEAGDRLLVPTRVRGLVSLRGEVKNPGVRELSGKPHLTDFINQLGGGFSERADRSQVEIRRGAATLLVNLESSGSPSADNDPALEPGDVVLVRDDSGRRVVVLGAVRKPGAFLAKPNATLLDVLSEADGTTDRADLSGIVLLRGEAPAATAAETAGRKPGRHSGKTPDLSGAIVIDLRKLRKGDATQNPVVQPGDRIVVQERPADGGRKVNLLDSVLRFVPLFTLFSGGVGRP